MGYIIKNTSGLVNTRLTDTGRKKLSQGNFNISYFQIGDSEVSYNTLSGSLANTMILEPAFNAQNSAGFPESNKENIKYPYYVDGITGNTYGIPFMSSLVDSVYNRAIMRGFFDGNTSNTLINWVALTNNDYAINSNYIIEMSTLTGSNQVNLVYSGCNLNSIRNPQVGDLITIYYDGFGQFDCNCVTATTTTTTSTSTTTTTTNPCTTLPPSTTTTTTCNVTPTPINLCPPTPPPYCTVDVYSCYQMMTYKITGVCNTTQIFLDREVPDFSCLSGSCYARTIIYPGKMTELYDSYTPWNHWNSSVINYDSVCYTDEFDVKIWNMNIPWSENLAGLNSANYLDYTKFGSVGYLGTKEYLGYASSKGQSFFVNQTMSAETTDTYFYDSFGGVVYVEPEDQKAIAIIHYTNQTVDLFYGEKFALKPNSVNKQIGECQFFRVHIPWLMWHKDSNCCNGQTFWVSPPNFRTSAFSALTQPHYMQSLKNSDMNGPGMRYYNLWDNNANINGLPSRVGKVFPDDKIIVIDDEEIIAAMSYKANRNWTLPAPQISLTTPNTCGNNNTSTTGILSANTECLYVTYILTNSSGLTNSLHCNYYIKIQGPRINCNQTTAQNVAVRFGPEFRCLTDNVCPTYTTTTTTVLGCPPPCDLGAGFSADKIQIICQKVVGCGKPDPLDWKILDVTDQISATTVNGYLTQSGITGNTFVITQDDYDNAPQYDLSNYISLTSSGYTGTSLNFGDEYYFYGNIETDIEATIYEMRYKINLSSTEFQVSSNPSWSGAISYVSEIGLYDSEKNLMIISKLNSPVVRTGVQQFLVKFDI